MEIKEITIRVNAKFPRIFEVVSEEQRRKIKALLSLKLGELTLPKKPLEELMSEISRKAQERGLTPEILDLLLNK